MQYPMPVIVMVGNDVNGKDLGPVKNLTEPKAAS